MAYTCISAYKIRRKVNTILRTVCRPNCFFSLSERCFLRQNTSQIKILLNEHFANVIFKRTFNNHFLKNYLIQKCSDF